MNEEKTKLAVAGLKEKRILEDYGNQVRLMRKGWAEYDRLGVPLMKRFILHPITILVTRAILSAIVQRIPR